LTVTVLGVRHHGPGSARGVEKALASLAPDAVLVEGPPEAEPLVALASDPEMRPPVALLAYAADEPGRAVFYPFARFSPEWCAIRYALSHEVALRFIDLPLAHVLAQPLDAETAGDAPADPLTMLAEAAGHGDPERFWEDIVEHGRADQPFASVADAMLAVRETVDNSSAAGKNVALREAAMRQRIRRAVSDGHERIAVICGAWHAPVLRDLAGAGEDARLLKGLPKRKVALTWVPWTYDRLSFRSGYGAGVTSPGWYDHVFQPDQGNVVIAWLVKTAAVLRAREYAISSAHVIEAVRLAEALAALRERPQAGLDEIIDATRAVLGERADAAMALIHDRLIVGEMLGSIPASAPSVPLQEDLARNQRRLRLRPEGHPPGVGIRDLALDLRTPLDRDRSRLLHRLDLLGIPWGRQRAAQGARGTFHEIWALEWQPEFAVVLIERSRYGTTVAQAATAMIDELAAKAATLAGLTELIETSLYADLPDAVSVAMTSFEDRAAVAPT
jgi:Family of unknown function (DUF5682)